MAAKNTDIGGWRAWLIVACGSVFYGYQFIIRVFPNVLTEEIMQSFAIDASAFGLIIGFYYWAYSGMQIPLGIMMDKFGPRRLLSSAGFVCGLACFIFASTDSTVVASFARLLMGMGAACGFLGTMKLATLWLPPQKIGNAIALTLAFGTIGASLGGPPLSYMTDALGLKSSLYILGMIGVIIGTVIFIVVRNAPKGSPAAPREGEHIFAGLKKVISSPQAWLISLFGMLMYASMIVMGDAWATPFIESVYTVDEQKAATLHTSLFIGAAMGAPFFTSLSDRLVSRKKPMFIGALLSLIIFMIIVWGNNIPFFLMYFLFFAGGFCYTSKSLCFASMTEIVPKSASGVSIGFTNMIVMAFGAALHPMIGSLLDTSWNGLVIDGSPVYSELNYRYALSVIPVCIALSLFIIGFINETHPGSVKRRYKRRR